MYGFWLPVPVLLMLYWRNILDRITPKQLPSTLYFEPKGTVLDDQLRILILSVIL